MNPEYLSLIFSMDEKDHELWLALLGEWPFESFHDEENTITGYIQQHDLNENLIRFIDEHKGVHYVDYELNKVPDKNWNEVWESSFNPVIVGDYCYIRAHFHESNDHFKHEIIIAPKIDFGTGHHATTFMMIQGMEKLNFQSNSIF